ncbi:MAG: hypothetical protein ICV60_05770 [Pyrinomonadaceae bacterium]|nr:hypothetical protein [Pyrinomonadaceae bacterium]
MANGLKGKVKQIVMEMHAIRTNPKTPRDISLREHLDEKYEQEPDALFTELGIDPHYTRVADIQEDEDNRYLIPEIVRQGIQRGVGVPTQAAREAALRAAIVSQAPVTSESNGGQRWISPEVYLDPVYTGAVQAGFWQDLIVRDEPISSDTVNIPFINLGDASAKENGEGETVEEGTVDYNFKKVTIKKRKRALKITDEAIMFNSLSLLSVFFEEFGRRLALALSSDAVNVIVNGDVAGGSQAAPIIGVTDTAKGFQYRDFLRVGIRFNQLGRVGIQAIGNEDTCLDYLDLPEVKNKQFAGSPLLAVSFKSAVQTPEDLYASYKVDDDQIVIQDPRVSLIKLTAAPLMVETERIVMKGINGSVASIFTGFAKLQRNASIRIDRTLKFNDAGANMFPDWMSPDNE